MTPVVGRGGDRLFRLKLEIQDDGPLPKDEKCGPIPVHQRNFRPRKPVPVDIEEISSSGDSEAVDPPFSERCTPEDLKRWLLVRFEKMENQFDEIRKIICRSVSMPEGTIRNTRKRKASDDLYRQTSSPDSIDIQTQGPNRKGKKWLSEVLLRKNICIRTDLETETTEPEETTQVVNRCHAGNTYTSALEDDQAKANEYDNARMPPPGKNNADQPESNVLPVEVSVI
ncbi:hypothetical protein Bca4012_037836 [Brassica carinata]